MFESTQEIVNEKITVKNDYGVDTSGKFPRWSVDINSDLHVNVDIVKDDNGFDKYFVEYLDIPSGNWSHKYLDDDIEAGHFILSLV